MDNKHLSSNILSTGNKFVVNSDIYDSTFGPGSLGIVSYVKGIDVKFANVVHLQVVTLRRGKQGKDRIDVDVISVPIFGFIGMISSKIMPDEKQKQYICTEPVHSTINTIYNMTDLNYLGWALSWALYLYKLSRNTKPFCVWPKKNKNIMNKMLDMPSYWKDDPTYLIETYCSGDAREKFIKQMRIIEVSLVDTALIYMSKVVNLEVLAITNLMGYRKRHQKICNKKMLDTTYKIFIEKRDNLELLRKKNITKPKEKLIFSF